MSPRVQEISEQAEALTAPEKSALIDLLLGQLDPPDPNIQRIWEQEVEQRILAAREGKLETYSYEEVMGKYLQP